MVMYWAEMLYWLWTQEAEKSGKSARLNLKPDLLMPEEAGIDDGDLRDLVASWQKYMSNRTILNPETTEILFRKFIQNVCVEIDKCPDGWEFPLADLYIHADECGCYYLIKHDS